MQCPFCQTTIDIPDYAKINVESYGKPKLVVVPCCGKAVSVYQVRRLAIAPYHGDKTEDDWGDPIKK